MAKKIQCCSYLKTKEMLANTMFDGIQTSLNAIEHRAASTYQIQQCWMMLHHVESVWPSLINAFKYTRLSSIEDEMYTKVC